MGSATGYDSRQQVECAAIGCTAIATTSRSWFCSPHRSKVSEGTRFFMTWNYKACFDNAMAIRPYADVVKTAIEELAFEDGFDSHYSILDRIINENMNRCAPIPPKVKPGQDHESLWEKVHG